MFLVPLATSRTTALRFLQLRYSFRCLFGTTSGGVRLDAKCWQVSSEGRCCDTRGNISYGTLRGSGYRSVGISGQNFLVHRLVKLSFHGPPPHKLAWQVHHVDGDPSNNRLDNLEYVTHQQNMIHSYENPSRGCGGSKRSKPVMWRARGSQSWTICESSKQAAKQLGMSSSFVSNCCRGVCSSRRFDFQFAEMEDELPGEEWRQMRDPRFGEELPRRMVSSLGRLRFANGRVSRGHQRKDGYFVWRSEQGAEMVHRLVATAFLGDPPSSQHTQINHKDGNKGNNAVDNLEYVTPQGNIVHYHATASRLVPRPDVKPVESRVLGSMGVWTAHESILSASKSLGVRPGNIFHCISGRSRQTGGIEFRLAQKSEVELAGEEWRAIDFAALIRDKTSRYWRPFGTTDLQPMRFVQMGVVGFKPVLIIGTSRRQPSLISRWFISGPSSGSRTWFATAHRNWTWQAYISPLEKSDQRNACCFFSFFRAKLSGHVDPTSADAAKRPSRLSRSSSKLTRELNLFSFRKNGGMYLISCFLQFATCCNLHSSRFLY